MKEFLNKLFRLFFPHEHPATVKRNYGLPQTLNLVFKHNPANGWFVVTSPDLPGFVTQAKNQDELIEMVNDGILSYFDVPRKVADIIYNQLNVGDVQLTYKGELVTRTA